MALGQLMAVWANMRGIHIMFLAPLLLSPEYGALKVIDI